MPLDNEQNNFEDEGEELSLVDVFNILWRRKFLIIFITGIFGVISLAYALTRPIIYRAECKILPPQSSRIEGLSSSLGGLADFVGLPRTATTGQMLLGILRGDSVIDAMIERFNLGEKYSQDIRLRLRSTVRGNLGASVETNSGLISIAYLDKDPEFAADIANAFVEELQKKLQEISMGDALQRRNFFESQLLQAQKELNVAEDDIIKYQQASGVIAFESQTQSLLASIASLRNQIAAKNVEISSMSSYARKDNPRLRLAQSQLDAMTKELRRLEEERRQVDANSHNRITSGDLLSSIGQVPELGIEYQRYVRALRFATAKYELMLRQYENARLSEANDLTTIFVVDKATPPDYKFSPRRARMTIMGTVAGGAFSVFLAFLLEHVGRILKAKRKREYDFDDDDDD